MSSVQYVQYLKLNWDAGFILFLFKYQCAVFHLSPYIPLPKKHLWLSIYT